MGYTDGFPPGTYPPAAGRFGYPVGTATIPYPPPDPGEYPIPDPDVPCSDPFGYDRGEPPPLDITLLWSDALEGSALPGYMGTAVSPATDATILYVDDGPWDPSLAAIVENDMLWIEQGTDNWIQFKASDVAAHDDFAGGFWAIPVVFQANSPTFAFVNGQPATMTESVV